MKPINEYHSKEYVTYVMIPRADSDNPVIKRKIRKDYVTIRKLLSVISKVTSPVIYYIDNEGNNKMAVAECEDVSDQRKLQILYSHNGTRSFLALKTFVFKDAFENTIVEIQYEQIRKVLFNAKYFEDIDAEMQQEGVMF